MDGSLVAAMISLCLSASQVGGLCPLPGGWSKITPPAAATAYIRSQEAAQQAQARREQEAQEMAQKKAEEEAQKAAQEEAKKAEEAAQQADFDYEAIAASFPQTPLQTSSMVGQDDEKSWWFQRNETKTPPAEVSAGTRLQNGFLCICMFGDTVIINLVSICKRHAKVVQTVFVGLSRVPYCNIFKIF